MGSVVDAAVIVTMFPEGTADGAVNVINWPLAVWLKLKEPQELPWHTAVQSTPALLGSKVTIADRFVAALTGRFAVGACDNAMVRGACLIVTTAVAFWLGSAVEVAVIVTVLPAGTIVGAVKTVKLLKVPSV